MRQVTLVVIDAIRNIVEILFLIWVQVLAPLKRVDRLKGFAKCDLITYRPRKINSAELRVGLRKDLGKEGHIATLRLFKVSSSLNPLEYLRPCLAVETRKYKCLGSKHSRSRPTLFENSEPSYEGFLHLAAIDAFGPLATARRHIGIVVKYICWVILRLELAQAAIVFRTVCQTHTISRVSRNEIGETWPVV